MSKKSIKQARKAHAKLEKAAEKFQSAIDEFDGVFKTDTVGLDEWSESINDVLFDIEADIDSAEEDEE